MIFEPLSKDFTYPYVSECDQIESISVTSLEETPLFYQASVDLPSQKSGLSASAKGTIIHAFMEYFPLDDHVDLSNYIDQLAQEGLYQEEEVDVLKAYLPHLNAFRASPCYQWLKDAEVYYVEQPFVLQQEDQIIHGTLDAFCIQNKLIRIIDYKTDRVRTNAAADALVNRHATQLSLYAEVLKKLYPDYQVEAWLYYLHIDRAVQVVIYS